MTTVLVADDAEFMRLQAAKVLSDNGYQVLHAENGRQAVDLYVDQRPDAVLMDISMPEMDGLQALKAIRQIDPAARVAMVSAMTQHPILLEALKTGARGFVLKPYRPVRLLEALN